MKVDELAKLDTGDIIQSLFDRQVYVVLANYGDHVVAVQQVDVTNAKEWSLVSKVVKRESRR